MADEIWTPYFAFGANLNKHTFYNVRKMRPRSAERAVLRGFELKFTEPGIPIMEPGFASIEPLEDGTVHGVLYEIHSEDFRRLNLSESANYERLDVEVMGESSGEVLAKAYRSKYPREGLKPSKRYRDMILQGAREQGLPEDYCQMLEQQPYAYIPGLSEAFHMALRPYIKLRAKGLRHETFINWLRGRE